jgi:ribonuclease HI
VARDHHGTFVEAAGNSFQQVVSPDLAEAIAIRFALSWAREEGMKNLAVASDCLSVVQRFKAAEKDRSACGVVIQDIRALVASFNNCSISYVSHV